MALIKNSDRIKETTSTTGTGTFSLAGVPNAQFQTFVAGVGTGNEVDYCAVDATNNTYEVGRGTVTDATPDTLSRDEVYESSNSDAAVNFAASPTVFCVNPAGLTPAPAWNYLYNGSGRIAQRGTQLGNRVTGTTTAMAPLTSLSSLAGLRTGMRIYGTNVTTGTTVSTIDSATQLTMSANGTGMGTNTMTIGLADGAYCADRWYVLWQTENVRYDRSTGDSDDYAIKITQNFGTAQRFGLAQVIEQKDSKPLRSKTVRAQCRVKVSTGTPTIRIAILEWTSTADSPTKDVVLDWTSGTFTANNFFLASNLTITATSSVAASTSWKDLYVTGSISSSANNIYVFIWTDATAAQDVTLEVTEAGLYEGKVKRNWQPRPHTQEQRLCERYHETTFAEDVAPTFSSSSYGHTCNIAATSAFQLGSPWRFRTPKRVAPTIRYFNGWAYNQQIRNMNTGTDFTGTTNNGLTTEFVIPYGTPPMTTAKGDLANIHMLADAEL